MKSPKGTNTPKINEKAGARPAIVDMEAERQQANRLPVRPTTNGHGVAEANRQAAKKTEDTAT